MRQLAFLLTSFCFVLAVKAQPTITSFTPISAKPGDSVVITGTGFNTTIANNIVFFGATRATVTLASATSLRATVPSSATFAPISVLNTSTTLSGSSRLSFNPVYALPKSAITAADFESVANYTANGSSDYSAIGDIDGDGKPDLVLSNYTSNTISIFRNTSVNGFFNSGSFAARVDFSTGSNPQAIALGDLDGDGKLDIAVSNLASNTVSVFRNIATSGSITSGSLASRIDLSTGTNSSPITPIIADFNGDGRPDLATTCYVSGVVAVFRNTFTGGTFSSASFGTRQDFSVGGSIIEPNSMAAGDLDGDGKIDLVVSLYQSSSIMAMQNTSTTSTINFSNISYQVGFNSASLSIALADIDGDSKLDILTGISGPSFPYISIRRNTSTVGVFNPFSFALTVNFNTNPSFSPRDLVVSDVNGDGKPDIGMYSGGSNLASIYLNTSALGSTTLATPIDVGGSSRVLKAIADMDGDGRPDIIGTTPGQVSISRNRSNDNFLSNLSLSSGTLSPAFNSLTNSYTATVPNASSSITVTPTVVDPSTSITINGVNASTRTISLSVGVNAITVLLTAQNGSTRTYTVNVTRLPSSNADLSSLTISSGTLSPAFTAGNISYTSTAGHTTTGVNVTPTRAEPNASIQVRVNGGTYVTTSSGSPSTNLPITTGTNTINVRVMAQDSTVKIYTVLVSKLTAPPTITSFSPTTGLRGATVTITGTGFDSVASNNHVYFGGVRANILSGTATSITVLIPAGAIYAPIRLLNLNTRQEAKSALFFRPMFTPAKSGVVATDFAAANNYTTGPGSVFVATGDLDGDGKLDLVSANNSVNTISVFRNTSTVGVLNASSFAAKQDFTAGSGVNSVAIGDLDGDGKLDIVVTNNTGASISVFRNTSTVGIINSSSFAARVDYATNTDPNSIAIEDLDLDGKPDLAVTNGGSGEISIFRNVSTPGPFTSSSFNTRVDLIVGNAYHITTGDLDSDGKPDLVALNNGLVSVLRNISVSGVLTAGSFAPKVDFGAASSPFFTSVGDLDGDNKPEIVVANANSSSVSVLRNTSSVGSITTSSFATRVDFASGLSTVAIALGDLDSDGKIDIVASNQYGLSVSMFRNNTTLGTIGTSSFTRADLTTLNAARSVIIADMDGDGRPEIAIASDVSNAISIHKNLSNNNNLFALAINNGTLTPSFTSNQTAYSVFLGNSVSSITVTPTRADSSATIRVNGSLINSGNTSSPIALSVGTNNINILVTAEDGSTRNYLIVVTRALPIPAITSINPIVGLVGSTITITGANFNTTASNNSVLFGATRATVLTATATTLTVTVPVGATYGPVTVLNTTNELMATSAAAFTPIYSPSKATLTASDFPLKQDFATATGPNAVAIGDLDGDGKPDLAIANYGGSGSVSVYRNISTTGTITASSFSSRVDFAAGSNPVSVAIGDLNGDGKPDLAVTNFSSASVSVFRNTATSGTLNTSSFAAKVDFTTGLSPWFVGIADFDMDGKPELAVTNRGENSISIFRNLSTGGTLNSSSFAARTNFAAGNFPRLAAIGDLNGDGKPELVVANQGSSLISVYRNTSTTYVIDSNTFAPKVDITSGSNPYCVAIGDVDGDNKPDIAVTNTGSTSVSILRNIVTGGAINTSSFAAKVDFASSPTPAFVTFCDLDGNGKLDLFVANQDGANVSVFRNTSVLGSVTASSFAAKLDFPTGVSPSAAAVADLDGDRKPDLIAINYNGGSFSVLRNADLSNNNNLSALSLSAGTLSPAFASSVTSYSASVANVNSTITITATRADSNASITINGVAVLSGIASNPIILNDGNNTIAVVVMAQDSTIKTYNIQVFRTPTTPVITSFSPASGVAGTTVTITGVGFNNIASNNRVFFGTTAATITAATTTSLTVTVPASAIYGPITTVNTSTGLSANSRAAFSPLYEPVKPTINSSDFSPSQSFATGPDPWSVASGDLDGDGKPELIIANRLSNNVSVCKNTTTVGSIATGSFAARQDFATGTNPNAVCVADIDRDGRLDLIVANTNSSSNSVSVLRNTSVGGVISFAAKQDFTVGLNPISVTTGDIDGDGRPEIIVPNSGTNTISILRNLSVQGNITSSSFAAKQDYTVGTTPYAVSVGDLDGDGKFDLAIVNAISNTISVMRNTATTGVIDSNSFAVRQDFTASTGPISITMADIDLDGKLDLAVANSSGVGTISIFRNTSTTGIINTGSFAARQDFTVGGSTTPVELCVGNLDGDNKPDIAVANLGGNSVSVFRNTSTSGSIGVGSFAARVDFSIGGGARSVTIVDLDADGRPDLAAANRSTSSVAVLRNSDFPPVIFSFSPVSGVVGSTVTINGSYFNPTPANNIVYFGATQATVTAATATSLTVTVPSGATHSPLSVLNAVSGLTCFSLASFNPVFAPAKSALSVLDFPTKQNFATGAGASAVAVGDLDGDGKSDLAVANYISGTVSLYRNISTTGSITASSFASKVDLVAGASPNSVAIGDLNGDGKLDLAVANNGSNSVSVFRNIASSGSLTAGSFAAKVDFTTASTPWFVAIHDMDKDGKSDLIVTNSGAASVSILRNTSVGGTIVASSFAAKVDFTTNTIPRCLAIGDLDRDGLPDVVVSSQTTSAISIFRNTSTPGTINTGSLAAKLDLTTASGPYAIAMGDVDGDGRLDLAVANCNASNVSVLRNTSFAGVLNSNSFTPSVNFTVGTFPRFISISDLDGDGKPDLVTANSVSDNFSILRNTASTGLISSTSFAAKVDVIAGFNPTAVVAADLDGDGKSDLAVTNYNDSTLSVFRNADISNNADLASLTLSAGTLNPVFSSSVTAYSATVSNATANLSVVAVVAQSNATIQVRINGGTFTALSSGIASGLLSLNNGINTLDVRVTAQNGATIKTYSVSVVRLAPITNNTISSSQLICNGSTPAALSGLTPLGGNGSTYNYQWLSSTISANAGFVPASGVNNTQNYTPSALTQNTWYRRLVTSDVLRDTSSAILITVNMPGNWTGLTSNDWSNATNWSCPQIPDSITDVTILSTALVMPAVNGQQRCRNLTIGTGASITTVGSLSQLSIYGNFTNTGSPNMGVGTIEYAGNTPQSIPTSNYSKLKISNPAGVVLNGTIILSDSLLLTNGLVTLGSHKILLNANSRSSLGSSTSYVRTNSTGSMQMNNLGISGDTGFVVFPVGNASYNPVILRNTGTADNFEVRVIDSVTLGYSNLVPIGSRVTSNAVNRTWVVTESSNGGSNLTLALQWNTSEELPGFNRSASYVSRYGSSWNSSPASAALGSNPYVLSQSGITTLSLFGVGSSGALPVDLLSFTANQFKDGAMLNWRTASEFNNDYFEIERSADAQSFTSIGHKVKGQGTTSTPHDYYFIDENAIDFAKANSGKVYYRLKQVDFNGEYEYSKICALIMQGDNVSILAQPNPFKDNTSIIISSNQKDDARIIMTDAKGIVISEQIAEVKEGYNQINLEHANEITSGIYFVTVITNQTTSIVKICKN